MLGGLHIETAALKMAGSFLKESGWTAAIEESGVATSGTAEYFLHAASVTKTRKAHQITACALYRLLKKAFEMDIVMSKENDDDFEQWCQSKCADQPSFKYWYLVLELELSILSFVRSFREGNFEAYKATIANLMQCLIPPYYLCNL